MKKINNPHDKLYKAAMTDLRVAKDFIQAYLPASILAAIELDSIKLMPNSYVDQALKHLLSDVMYEAKLKGKENEHAYLYFLFEQESKPNPHMPFRAWQYTVSFWADYLKQHPGNQTKLPLVVPVIFYTGQAPYNVSTDIRDLIQAPATLLDEVLFRQTFQLVDVNKITDDELQLHQWAGMLSLIMKHIRDRDILLTLKQVIEWLKSLEQAGGTDFIILLLHYCLMTGETLNIQEFVQTVQHGLSHETGSEVMTIAEQLIEKGKLEGKLEGKAEGEIETLITIAKKAFQRRLALEEIQALTGLSFEKLDTIRQEVVH